MTGILIESISSEPEICPQCGGEDMFAEEFDQRQNGEVQRPVVCNLCKYEWLEVFTFSHAEELLPDDLVLDTGEG